MVHLIQPLRRPTTPVSQLRSSMLIWLINSTPIKKIKPLRRLLFKLYWRLLTFYVYEDGLVSNYKVLPEVRMNEFQRFHEFDEGDYIKVRWWQRRKYPQIKKWQYHWRFNV